MTSSVEGQATNPRTWMIFDKLGDVVNPSVHHQPSICPGLVRGYLLDSRAEANLD